MALYLVCAGIALRTETSRNFLKDLITYTKYVDRYWTKCCCGKSVVFRLLIFVEPLRQNRSFRGTTIE